MYEYEDAIKELAQEIVNYDLKHSEQVEAIDMAFLSFGKAYYTSRYEFMGEVFRQVRNIIYGVK